MFTSGTWGNAMKVYDGSLKGAAAETARAAETQRAGRESSTRRSGAGSTSGDRVELSSALRSLSRALESYSARRSGQVEALSAQYESGQYRADAAATSRGLVVEALSQGTL